MPPSHDSPSQPLPPRPRTPRQWLIWALACALATAVCVFAVIGVVSVLDQQPAVPAEKPASGPLGFAVSPRAVLNCHTVAFNGRLAPNGVPVSLEGRFPGRPWRTFKVVYTDRNGRFTARYDFTRTTSKTRYAFRAVIGSVPTSVLVTPRGAGPPAPWSECA